MYKSMTELWTAAKRVLNYLAGTAVTEDTGIIYGSGKKTCWAAMTLATLEAWTQDGLYNEHTRFSWTEESSAGQAVCYLAPIAASTRTEVAYTHH